MLHVIYTFFYDSKKKKKNELAHDKTYNQTCATSEDQIKLHSDQSLHWFYVPSTASRLSKEW